MASNRLAIITILELSYIHDLMHHNSVQSGKPLFFVVLVHSNTVMGGEY